MKKIAIFTLFAAAALTFSSCEQESLDPLPEKVEGMYVILNVQQATLEFDNFETTAFRGTLTNPSSNIVRYELFVRRRNPNGVSTSNTKLLETITSFPHQLEITPAKIAAALEVPVTELAVGDVYRFIGYSYDASGTKTGYNNLSAVLRTTPTMKQGYKWSANAAAVINPGDPFNIYTPFSNN
ncbi:hypothetical protein [Flavobacterium caeni]|uniref:Uncharacterized protein n=1 Tax=Flavobacterium caeni TaxID=490189 RepID=A0A1G5J3Y5_9FLAO|nr:hypothetical protein [Flavobacterium caeni]SCY82661.1 hypothetical protein SAMN02927903_02505 [Flavobacterium caeni]